MFGRILQLVHAAGLTGSSIEIAAGSRDWRKGCERFGFDPVVSHDIIYNDEMDLKLPQYVSQQCDDAARCRYCVGHVGVCCTTFSTFANPPYRCATNELHPEWIIALPNLSQKKRTKALEANMTCDNAVSILESWHGSGMLASLENLHNPMIWQYMEWTGP